MTTFLIGADPEFWLMKDGKHVSAYGMVEGTKQNPQPLTHGAVQVDGMALEVNINPADTWREFRRNIVSVMKEVRALIPDEYEFDFSPVAEFGSEYIKSQPDKARELGCEPDMNAYTGEPNATPDEDAPFRTAAGHFHIGWCEGVDPDLPAHVDACRTITKELDSTLGILSQLWDTDTKRKDLYGKRGAFRSKPYGVEYRVLSCKWLENLEDAKACFYLIKNTVNHAMRNDVSKLNDRVYGATSFINGRSFATARGRYMEILSSFRLLAETGLTYSDTQRKLPYYPKFHMMSPDDGPVYENLARFAACHTLDDVRDVQRMVEREREAEVVAQLNNAPLYFTREGNGTATWQVVPQVVNVAGE